MFRTYDLVSCVLGFRSSFKRLESTYYVLELQLEFSFLLPLLFLLDHHYNCLCLERPLGFRKTDHLQQHRRSPEREQREDPCDGKHTDRDRKGNVEDYDMQVDEFTDGVNVNGEPETLSHTNGGWRGPNLL